VDELRRGGEPSVDIVPTDRMLLPPDREGMRIKQLELGVEQRLVRYGAAHAAKSKKLVALDRREERPELAQQAPRLEDLVVDLSPPFPSPAGPSLARVPASVALAA